MKQQESWLWRVIWVSWSLLMIAQFALSFFFHNTGILVLRTVGWVIWFFSIVFGWLPIFEFRRKGNVAKGKSYVQTTTLVDTGLYAIVRHPQYLAGMLVNVALALIAQHWPIIVLGAVAMVLGYAIMLKADEELIEKFGDDYKRYMQRVPRMNVVLGLIRLLARRETEAD